MTTPSPADGLRECLALLEKATPGEWRWSPNGNIVPAHYTDDCEIAAVYSEHMDDVDVPDNAAAIIAAVNFLRDHGPALATALRLREGCQGLVRYDVAPDSVQTPYGPGLTINRYEEPDGEYVRADDLARILEQTK